MSLKGFHIVFIIFSVLVTLIFAFWSVNQYGVSQQSGYCLSAAISFVLAGLLTLYGFRVAGKLQV